YTLVKFRGRNAVGLEETLGETFAGLQLGFIRSWTDNRQAIATELVHDASAQRNFRAHEREIDLLLSGKSEKPGNVVRRNGYGCGDLLDTSIAGRNENAAPFAAERLRNSVFTSTGTNNKDVHQEEISICVKTSFSAP